MICTECGTDDKEKVSDDLSLLEELHICKAYLCAKCRRTPDEIQADYDKESANWKKHNQQAHDWNAVPNDKLTGGASAKLETTK